MSEAAPAIGPAAALRWLMERRDLVVPMAFLGLVAVLVVPLPPWAMDLLLCTNVALSAIVLMTVINMRRPLDFSVFPALLLGTTLLRLVLNVASTRLILGMEAPSPAQAGAVAGHVIQAFADVVAGRNAVVGGVVFLILVVVQFVVVTKGATRMSEVAARFALVRVADEVLLARELARHEAPLEPRREAGAAAAAQSRGLDLGDDLLGRHRPRAVVAHEHPAQRRIAATRHIVGEPPVAAVEPVVDLRADVAPVKAGLDAAGLELRQVDHFRHLAHRRAACRPVHRAGPAA